MGVGMTGAVSWKRWWANGAWACWSLLGAACATPEPVPAPPPPKDARPDILFVTIDTLRADRVGVYGDTLAKTPTLDALAAKGVLFREAHAVTPLTLPSHTSMLTGLYPLHHGIRDNGGFRLGEDVPTIADALSNSGYTTAAFVSAFVLDGAWGLDRGFDVYRDPFHPQEVAQVGAFGEVELPSAEVVNAAVAWWRSAGKEKPGVPRFAWVHLYDPHTPWRSTAEGDPYRGDVAAADSVLARMVAEVGEDTYIIVTSDHGEGLWSQGEREHGVLLGRAITRVPLLVRPPGGVKGAEAPEPRAGLSDVRRPAGIDQELNLDPVPDAPRAARVVDVPVSGVDIAPTIAEVAGVSFASDGLSLVPWIQGTHGTRGPVYAETFLPLFHLGWSPLLMAQDGQFRREEGARVTLVDWTGANQEPPSAAILEDVIAALRGTLDQRPAPIDSETAAALEALGYLTVTAPIIDNPPDPRDRIDTLSALHAAEAQPLEVRLPLLEALVASEPDLIDAEISLSLARAEAGDRAGAREATRAALQRWPDHPTGLFNAAALALEAGDFAESQLLVRRLLAINPQDARGWRMLVAVNASTGDVAAMKEAAVSGLNVAPEDPNLHYLLALAEVQGGDPAVALDHLAAARRFGSQATDIDLWTAIAHERIGQIDDAMRAYQAATRSMPNDGRPWAMAGWMLYQAGRCADAWPFLVNVAKRGASRDPKVMEAMQACNPKKDKAPEK